MESCTAIAEMQSGAMRLIRWGTQARGPQIALEEPELEDLAELEEQPAA